MTNARNQNARFNGRCVVAAFVIYLHVFFCLRALLSNCSSLACVMAACWCGPHLRILPPVNEHTLISPAASCKEKRGDANASDNPAGGQMSFRSRPFSSFVVPDAERRARWLPWNHLSTTGETMAMWKTAFIPNNVSRPTKSLNC